MIRQNIIKIFILLLFILFLNFSYEENNNLLIRNISQLKINDSIINISYSPVNIILTMIILSYQTNNRIEFFPKSLNDNIFNTLTKSKIKEFIDNHYKNESVVFMNFISFLEENNNINNLQNFYSIYPLITYIYFNNLEIFKNGIVVNEYDLINKIENIGKYVILDFSYDKKIDEFLKIPITDIIFNLYNKYKIFFDQIFSIIESYIQNRISDLNFKEIIESSYNQLKIKEGCEIIISLNLFDNYKNETIVQIMRYLKFNELYCNDLLKLLLKLINVESIDLYSFNIEKIKKYFGNYIFINLDKTRENINYDDEIKFSIYHEIFHHYQFSSNELFKYKIKEIIEINKKLNEKFNILFNKLNQNLDLIINSLNDSMEKLIYSLYKKSIIDKNNFDIFYYSSINGFLNENLIKNIHLGCFMEFSSSIFALYMMRDEDIFNIKKAIEFYIPFEFINLYYNEIDTLFRKINCFLELDWSEIISIYIDYCFLLLEK